MSGKKCGHELALLPYKGVFDSLADWVAPDGTVTLIGQVTRAAQSAPYSTKAFHLTPS